MKVLVVEDDALLADFVARCLENSGFTSETVYDGKKGYDKIVRGNYECVVLDINLPNMLGTEICTQLRDRDITTPILFLSSRHSVEDRVHGLEIGADDYLVKPFSHDELIARVKALVRRPVCIVGSPIEQGDLLIDTLSHEVFVRGMGIKLTPKEFQLLEVLARNPGAVMTREYLLETVWGVTVGNTSNRLEVCVRGLRNKLSNKSGREYIVTEYGVGYRLER